MDSRSGELGIYNDNTNIKASKNENSIRDSYQLNTYFVKVLILTPSKVQVEQMLRCRHEVIYLILYMKHKILLRLYLFKNV